MRVLLALVLVTFAVPDRPNPSPKKAQTPQEQLLGDWQYSGNGPDNMAVQSDPNFRFRFTPTESLWIHDGKPSPDNGLTAKIAIDWTRNPVTIDFMPRNGGMTLVGIIRIESDRLILCWSNDQNRPTDFVSPHNIHFFTRIKS